jgi:hypothetical protein
VSEWRLSPPHPDEPVLSKADYRQAHVRLRWTQLGLAVVGTGMLLWMIGHLS